MKIIYLKLQARMIGIRIIIIIMLMKAFAGKSHIICDCERARTKAVIDLSVPDYCNHMEKYTHVKPRTVPFRLVSKKKPPYKIDAFLCEMYIKELTITGSFWVGSYDSVYRQYTRSVNIDDCKRMINDKLCIDNKVEESEGVYKYETEVVGKGHWYSTTVYKVTNCIGHKITLYQETPDSAIMSPIGILPGAVYSDGFAYHNQKMIIWEKSNTQARQQFETCEPYQLIEGNGTLTHTEKQGRLVDKSHQIEILFNTVAEKFCTFTKNNEQKEVWGYPVYGLPGAYLKFEKSIHHERKARSVKSPEVIFDARREEDGEFVNVQKLLYEQNVQREYSEYLEAVNSYKDVAVYGFINLISKPEIVITANTAFEPMFLDMRVPYAENDRSQKFKLENYKLWEITSDGAPPLCISVRDHGEGLDSTIELHGCYKNSSVVHVNWQVPAITTTEWTFDINDGMLIDVKSSKCLTYSDENKLTMKKCQKYPNNVNQRWSFSEIEYDKRYNKFRESRLFPHSYDDEPHIEEQIEFIRREEQIIQPNEYSFAHGRIGLYKVLKENNQVDLSECVSIKEKNENAIVSSCIDRNKLDFYTPVRGTFQDFEHLPDYTIRRTSSNMCLDVLLNKKKTSRKFLFPSESRRDGDKTTLEAITIDNNFGHSDRDSIYQAGTVIMQHCKPGSSKWVHDPDTKQLINFEINEKVIGCLTKVGITLFMRKCNKDDDNQKWVFDLADRGKYQAIAVAMVKDENFFDSIQKLPKPDLDKLRFTFNLTKRFKKDVLVGTEKSSIKNIPIMNLSSASAASSAAVQPGPAAAQPSSTAAQQSSANVQHNPATAQSSSAATQIGSVAQTNIVGSATAGRGLVGAASNTASASNTNLKPVENKSVVKPPDGTRIDSGENKFKIFLKNMLNHSNGSSTADVDIEHLSDFIKEKLLPLHSQYLLDKQTDHENELAHELRAVYCQIAKMKRNQLMTIAQLSPILAARTMGMKPCERVDGRGESLLLQECKQIVKQIGAFQSICNFQPYFTHSGSNYTIGRDGFSAVKITGDPNN
jgi:hypothetical protein